MEIVADASAGEDINMEYTTLCANELREKAVRLSKEKRCGYWTGQKHQ